MLEPIDTNALHKMMEKVELQLSTALHGAQATTNEFHWLLAHLMSDVSKYDTNLHRSNRNDEAYRYADGNAKRYLGIEATIPAISLYSEKHHLLQNESLNLAINQLNHRSAQAMINFANACQTYSLSGESQERSIPEDVQINLPWYLQVKASVNKDIDSISQSNASEMEQASIDVHALSTSKRVDDLLSIIENRVFPQ